MTTNETPSECAPTKDKHDGQTKPSPTDLTNANNVTNLSRDDDEPSQSSSQNSSPVKKTESGSKNKSRNRRRNEAKRRSAGGGLANQITAGNQEQSEKQKNTHDRPQVDILSESDAQRGRANEDTKSKKDEPIRSLATKQIDCTKGKLDAETKAGIQIQTNVGDKHSNSTACNREKRLSKEYKDLKDQLKSQATQIQNFVGQIKQQSTKIKELEVALISTNKTCGQLDKLLQQELSTRKRLETENDSLNQTITRLKTQISMHEKNKSNNDELLRVLNATLMERETEVSILKLKLTRLQTNPSSTMGLNAASSVTSIKLEPNQVYASSGRSNSEFDRNSYIRSSMIAEAASVRASTSQLKCNDRDASVWATVPEELTPSKRPVVLEKNFQPLYGDPAYFNPYVANNQPSTGKTSTPLVRDRRYKTLPRSMKSPTQDLTTMKTNHSNGGNQDIESNRVKPSETACTVTNLDDSNSTNQGSCNKTTDSTSTSYNESKYQTSINDVGLPQNDNHHSLLSSIDRSKPERYPINAIEESHYSTIGKTNSNVLEAGTSQKYISPNLVTNEGPPSLPMRTQTTPVKTPSKVRRIFDKFRRTDSSSNSNSKTDLTNVTTPVSSPFKRNATRSTMVGAPKNIQAQMSPVRQVVNFQTDKPFAKWDTDMLVDWLTMIGLSMYTSQCRRWVKCGAHIMNATPAEVDKGLGITNHLHQKKLRLAISELNGDCDKVTKAAAKLDYLWVARWLDDIGLPQYKEAFINARVDGRVLNYLTVDDLLSMGVKSLLHHASIRCGIKVLRSIQFDLQLLKRRATAEEIEQMNKMRQQIDHADETSPLNSKNPNLRVDTEVPLWTCHRVMEWLRLIDFAEFAPNLRGSGVHGGLIVHEDGFNIDTMCSLLSIPVSRTLLRRHLSTFFRDLIGNDLVLQKRQYQDSPSNQQLNPSSEIKLPKKSPLWFSKKSSKVAQDGFDEYLCPMYPVEPTIVKSHERKSDFKSGKREVLSKIPESINI